MHSSKNFVVARNVTNSVPAIGCVERLWQLIEKRHLVQLCLRYLLYNASEHLNSTINLLPCSRGNPSNLLHSFGALNVAYKDQMNNPQH